LRDCAALMLRTGWVVVRRMVRLSLSSRSMVTVSADDPGLCVHKYRHGQLRLTTTPDHNEARQQAIRAD
jgi:hypothetical protein